LREALTAGGMSDVEIEYCVPCGFLDRALDLQRGVLENFGQSVDSAALVTGDSGVFQVRVDGDPVWDKADDEYDVDEVVRRVRAAL
jgi:selenoprotein W-related protein